MAATHRASTTSLTGSNGTLSLAATVPTNSAGDLLIGIAVAASAADPTITGPAGWTLVGSANDFSGGGYVRVSVYKKTSSGSEPGTYTFSTSESTSARFAVEITAYQGAGDIDQSSFLPQATTATTRPTASITISETRTVLALFVGRNGETWTDPGSTTRRATQTSSNVSLLHVDASRAAGTFSYTATASASSGTGVSVLLVLTDAVLSDPPVIDVERPAENIVDLRGSTTGDLSTATFPTPVRVSGPTLTVTSLATGLWLFTQDSTDPAVYTVRVNQTDGQYDTENVTIDNLPIPGSSNYECLIYEDGQWV